MSASFCPQDASFLLSSGRDGKTYCWDMPRRELRGELSSHNGWAFDVQWSVSPDLPCFASVSSLDGQVYYHHPYLFFSTHIFPVVR